MSAYLAYSYSACLSKKEQIKIDNEVKINRYEFGQGFLVGVSTGVAVSISILSLKATAANAVDPIGPQPRYNGQDSPGCLGAFFPQKEMCSAICGAALTNCNVVAGLTCGLLIAVGGVIYCHRLPKP